MNAGLGPSVLKHLLVATSEARLVADPHAVVRLTPETCNFMNARPGKGATWTDPETRVSQEQVSANCAARSPAMRGKRAHLGSAASQESANGAGR